MHQEPLTQSLLKLPEFASLDVESLQPLLDAAVADVYEAGTELTAQHHPADHLFLLVSGRVRISQVGPDTDAPQPVGHLDWPLAIVGWSGLGAPFRYTTTATCLGSCEVLRWSRADMEQLFGHAPELGVALLTLSLRSSLRLLRVSRELLGGSAKTFSALRIAEASPAEAAVAPVPRVVLGWLRRSEFFEVFTQSDLDAIATCTIARRFRSGQRIQPGGSAPPGLYFLAAGSVALHHAVREAGPDAGSELEAVFLRTLSEPGRVLCWSFADDIRDEAIVPVAAQDALVYILPRDEMASLVRANRAFGVRLVRRLLQLVANQLRTVRAQWWRQKEGDELVAVQQLIAQSAPRLAASSPMHKVAHLLAERTTQGDAFALLERMRSDATPLEQNLSGLCLDLLTETRRENAFHDGLRGVYDLVVNAPGDEPPGRIRNRSARALARAFEHVRTRVEGRKYLPEGSGHIFVLNHLISHPYHALPNRFELALDTHMVAALVLLPKYGDSGVRVVRRSRYAEYGHQAYYGRLGHVMVSTNESEAREDRRKNLDAFLSEAGDHLRAGRNLVVCPEGTSLSSGESPGPFRVGTFLLAQSVEPEPLIVPVAVVNIDKRLRNRTLTLLIKPPFRLSDHVETGDREGLSRFLEEFRGEFRGYVAEARRLARESTNA